MRKFCTLLFFIFFVSDVFSQVITYPGTTPSFCPGGNVLLTASNPPVPTGSYQWEFSLNGSTGWGNVGVNASTYSATAIGFYRVTISGPPIVTFPAVEVTQNPNPVASFTATPQNQCSTVPVNFINTSTGGNTYLWNFGDPNSGANNTSTLFSPVHRFIGTSGIGSQSFTVTLTVTSSFGCITTITQTVTTTKVPSTLLGGTNPSVYNGKNYFTACGVTSSIFDFFNLSTTNSTNTFYEIVWGDASPNLASATFPSPLNHTYNVGNYNLQFIVTSNNGCKDTGYYYVFVGSNPTGSISSPGSTYGCTGSTFLFPIIQNNSPGTEYIISVNDGSPTVTYTQANVPAVFTHVFNQSSCGIAPNNTYTVSYNFTNPCSETPGTIGGIRISQKAISNFSISPRDTICQNTIVTFASNGTGGLVVPVSGGGSCTNGKIIWSISPSTGWNLLSGSLGSDNGFPLNTNNWTSGTSPLQINFTNPGTYTIKLKSGANTCGIDSITKTICVNPTPTGAFTVDNISGCNPLIVQTTSTTNLPVCGLTKFLWTVTYAATTGCTPGTSVFNYLNATNANSANPQFQFINPGIYSISFVNIFPASACTSAVVTRIITVKAKPIVVLAPVPTVCVSQSINPSATTTCYITAATTYSWIFDGGTPATSGILIPGAVTFATPGPHDITLAVTNECGTTTVTQQVTVNPLPQLTIPSSASFCVGENAGPFVFTSSTAGTTITWTNNNTSIGLPASGTGNIASFITTNLAAAPIVATITVTANNGICSKQDNFTITVKPKPALPSVTTPVSYCQNATALPLNATAATGNTLLWYTTSSGGVGGATPITPQTTTVNTTIYYVSQVSGLYNCEGARAAISVTINPIPAITATSMSPSVCGGTNGNITISGLIPSLSYTVRYIKNGTLITVVISANASGIIIINGLSSGTYTNLYVVSNTNCPSNEVGPFVLADPSQPATPTVGSNTPLCSGGNINLTASSTTSGVSYSWSGPAAFTSNLQNPTITNAAVANSGNYFVTASLNGCTSLAAMVSVIVNPTPVLPTVSSNAPICANNNLNLFSNTITTGALTYAWSSSTGFTSTDQNPIIPNAQTFNSGTYTVIATATTNGQACPSGPATITVLVKPVPVITLGLVTNPNNCSSATGSIALNGLANNTTYTVNFTNSGGPQTASIATNASGVLTIVNLTAGIYNNITVTLAGCISNMVGPITLFDPNPPVTPVVPAIAPLCSGNNINLSASTTSTGAATYLWNGPGFTSSLQNPVIPIATVANSGLYSVTVTIAGCTSAAASVNVTVNQTPATPTASSNSPVCTNNTLTLNAATTTAGAMTYAWTGPNGFTSALQNPTIPNVTLTAGGIYNVIFTATTGNCASIAGVVSVVINATPVISIGLFVNPSTCSSATGSINLNGLLPNTLYSVNYTKNSIAQTPTLITSNGTGILTIANLTQGTFDNFTVTLIGCISNMVGPVTLNDPAQPAMPVVPAVAPLCSGNNINLSASTTSTGTATYLWNGPGFTSGLQNPIIMGATVVNSGTYSVVVTIVGCTSAAASVNVVVNQTPVTPTASSNSPVCTNNTLTLNSATSTPGTMTYAWTGPNGFTSTLQNPTIPNVTTAANGIYNVIFTATTGNCPSATGVITVVINATPFISNGTAVNPTACGSATGSINLNGLLSSTFYSIGYTKNTIPQNTTGTTNATGTLTVSNLTAGTYDNFTVTINGCVSNMVGPFILVDPNPPVLPIVTGNNPLCAGATLNLTANTTSGAATYQWSGPNGFNSALQSPSIPNIAAVNAGSYSVIATINNCVSPAGSIMIVVNPQAVLPQVNSPINYCIGTSSSALTATANTGHSLNWYNVPTGGVVLSTAPTPLTTIVGSTLYYVSQTTALGCEGPRASIEVKINPDALAVFMPTDIMKCAPFVITPFIIGLQTFPANNSNYEWYANNVLIGTGIIFPGYTILNGGDSITIKLKTLSPFGCKADSMSRKFYTFKIPVPSFTMSDTVGCGPISITFVNTTPDINLFTYNWNFGNGITSTLQQPGTILFATNPTFGDTTYIIKLKVATLCDTITFQKTLRVKSKPRALYTPSITAGCSPMRVKFTNTSLGLNNTYYWNFDDGTNLTTTSLDTFTHIFTTGVIDTFRVKLIAVNDCGADSITYLIIAQPNNIFLNFSVNGTQLFGCAPHPVAFINNSVGGSSFIWNFGDGNTLSTTANIDTVYHTYANPGTYTAVLQAINSCTDTAASKTITVYPKPVPLFIASSYNVCIGQSVQFTNQSTLANSYSWNFGDGTFSTLISPSHTYSTPGLYTVVLTCIRTNPSGNVCIDSFPRQIQVTAGLPGLFSVQNAPGLCAPHTVTFVNRNVPSVTTLWNFGDGNIGTGDSVLHTYLNAGVYTVSLITTVPGGCTYTSQSVVTISGPGGTLQYLGGFKCFPNGVSFIANVTNTDSIRWNFGDGTFAVTTTNSIFHNYAGPGIYVPSASFLNIAGCNFSVIGIDTIRVDKIDSGFVQSTQKFCGYTNVLFTDTSVAFFGKQLVKWRFGDGGTGTGSVINHTYTNSGTYNVEMIVIGNSGCSDTTIKSLVITVNALPVANIIGPVTGCTNNLISFSANVVSADTLTHLNWLLPNGVTGSGLNFSYNFTVPGIYILQLFAGTTQGCFDTASHTIIINPSPVINASNSFVLCRGNSAQLNVVGTTNYQWSPIQGLSCSTCPNPIAAPVITTPYIVTGTNNFGCTAVDTVVVTVIQPTQISLSGNTNICVGDTANLLASGAAIYAWTPALTLSDSTVSNPLAFPTATTTYRVVGYDGYNCFTDTAFVTVRVGKYPTVNLGPDVTLAAGTRFVLNSIVTNGPIAQWLWTPTNDLSCSNCALPTATIKKDISYIVKATTAFGCSASDTINIKVFCENSQLFIPNTFTPDGDGLNDILMVRGKGIVSVKYFRIFNRWGELVFERTNFAPNNISFGWNGKVKGIVGPPDVFVYTAEVICENGTVYTYKGNTSIIK